MYELLTGMRIVEMAAFVAAPSCGLHLAQLGAQVIRIDPIGGGPDFWRWPRASTEGASLYWEGLNKGKKSVALDLSRPEGRELAIRIATAPGNEAGLFVTNYPVDGFLAYEKLRRRRDDLICVRIMGWPDGRPALDYTVNAAIGFPFLTGAADDLRPVNHVLPAWDLLAGTYAAFILVVAERSRRTTGAGREVRVPLSDIALASVGSLGQIAEVSVSGCDRARSGNEIYGAFGRDFVSRDGRRFMIAAITARQWQGLLQALALQPQVAAIERELGVSFATDEGMRFRYSSRLNPLFESAIAQRDSADLTEAFELNAVTWAPYQTLKEAITADPYFSGANPILAEMDHPSGQRYLTPGSAASLPTDRRLPACAAPGLGANTDEVLSEVVGLSGLEIASLHDAGIVASA